jgi:NADH-quinone oxidoreductase subunit N
MFVAFISEYQFWVPLFAVFSLLTMTVGNLVALQQRQLVRLLAYSGIAQAGYILLPFALVSADATVNAAAFSAAVTYILIYGIMNLGAFGVAVAVSRRHPRLLLSDLAGMAKLAPVLAIGMTVFMISLAGIPPTGGFWGKFLIFQAGIERGGLGIWLAAAMVINSVISIYYYFAVPRQMIFLEPAVREELRPSWLVTGVVVAAAAALLVIFVIPNFIANLGDVATLTGTVPAP